MSNNRMTPLIYINGHYYYINHQLLKKLRSGTITVFAVGVVVYLMYQLSGVRELGKFNAPTVDSGFGLNPTYSRTSFRNHQEFVGLTKEERPMFFMFCIKLITRSD